MNIARLFAKANEIDQIDNIIAEMRLAYQNGKTLAGTPRSNNRPLEDNQVYKNLVSRKNKILSL